MKNFEWNFQQSFLRQFSGKWIPNGWAWPPFDTSYTHFLKTQLFRKLPLKPNKSWKFQNVSVILGNHFIELFNGILHVLMFWVVANKQWDFDSGYILICHRLYGPEWTYAWEDIAINVQSEINVQLGKFRYKCMGGKIYQSNLNAPE